MILTKKQKEIILQGLNLLNDCIDIEDFFQEVEKVTPIDDGLKDQPSIKVTIKHGGVQDVTYLNWPKDILIPVVVYNYDTEGVDEDELSLDNDGKDTLLSVWDHKDYTGSYNS